jgi:hypothetical protein
VVAVSYADISRYEQATRLWEADHATADGAYVCNLADPSDDPPGLVPWHVLHNRCGAVVNPYGIDSGRICTWQQVASWCAQLQEKRWLSLTAWSALLRRAGAL